MGFQWASQPTHARLFFFYLVVVLGVAIVRSIRITRYLSSKSQRKDRSGLEVCCIDAGMIGRLATLTLLVSVLVCTYGAYPTWADHFNNGKVTGQRALLEALAELLERFSRGILVSTVLFGASIFFTTRLAKLRVMAGV